MTFYFHSARGFVGFLLAFVLAAGSAHAQDAATAKSVRDRALTDPTAWRLLESLTTEVGPRMAGTPGMERARDWAEENLRALGFSNIQVEEFPINAWVRGPEAVKITAPYAMDLSMLGLGRSPATPPGGIEAEVAVFATYAELLAQRDGALTGKIAVVNQPMIRTQDASGYIVLSPARRYGPEEAAKRGAVGYLVRSLTPSDANLPHTGAASSISKDWPTIPAAALAPGDADHLARLAARGPVRVRLSMQPTVNPDAVSWTISGDLPGTEQPDEIVLIGGHIDSWDVGPSAHDDGAGVAITMAAARAISRLPRYPRRTIRVVLFGAEEMDESAAPYAALHADDNIIAASESDFGGGRIWKVMLPERSRDHAAVRMAGDLLAPLGVFIDRAPAPYGGADLVGLQRTGTPVFLMGADGSRYFDVHHSADDTLDKIDREDLNQAVASWATVVYLLADSDIDFREAPPEPVVEETPAADEPPADTLERLSLELNAEEADE